MLDHLTVLVVGGDGSLRVALNDALGETGTAVFLPSNVGRAELLATSAHADLIVAVTADHPDPIALLGACRDLGLQRRTLAVGDPLDRTAAGEAVALGVAGFITVGSEASHFVKAISHVMDNGVILDPQAADAYSGQIRLDQGTGLKLNAARAFASALELKDTYTGGHAERVTGLAMRLAEEALLEEAFPSEALEAAFLLHDVGKIGIPESILTKPGKLSDTERRVMQTHPILGEQIIAPLGLPQIVHHVVRHHHETWDGSGYPDRLSGEDIPAGARLFSIADAIDAMTSVRPYRRPLSFEEALVEVSKEAGSQFDPTLVKIAQDTFLRGTIDLAQKPRR